MAYVDGFLMPVPKKNVDAYKTLARKAGDLVPASREHQAVNMKRDEVVFFSWIAYKSHRHHDAVNMKVIADPRIASMGPGQMPFDDKRMIWGWIQTRGFALIAPRPGSAFDAHHPAHELL